MKCTTFCPLVLLTLALTSAGAQDTGAPDTAAPALTLYNQNFAVVRQSVPLTLQAGLNHVSVNDITVHLEPDSVILRDPTGKRSLSIREQNYRADPLTQDLLLSLYEGQTIPFVATRDNKTVTVMGRIIRSGYVPHSSQAYAQYGQNYYQQQQAYAGSEQPVIEVDGKVQFGLPGQPQFPSLPGDAILKPTLDWTLDTDKSGPFTAELAYVTGGMTWSASYNVVAPETDTGTMDLVGWVTMDNQSGKTFPNARIKLMAGDVSKLQPNNQSAYAVAGSLRAMSSDASGPPVTEKTFDEYHLYTLQHPTTLRDRETKQVEFVRANGINYTQLYVYDGVLIDHDRYSNFSYENIRSEQSYGAQSNPKVAVMREFVNSQANHLGVPLPKGRVRFYKQDSDRQLEFTGENTIDHTPKDETLRIFTGNAFDLTGERTQTNYKSDYNAHAIDESFSITVRSHKKTPVEVRVVEHLYRGATWTIPVHSRTFLKTDAHTIEFRVPLAPDEARTLTYTAHYTW